MGKTNLIKKHNYEKEPVSYCNCLPDNGNCL